MGGSGQSTDERVNVFGVGERYLFKHYFEGDAVFTRLKRYYNNQQYRFEVPVESFDEVRAFLSEHDYDLVVVDDLDRFVVVVEKYTHHPENIFKSSVMQRGDASHNFFLLKDQAAVEQTTYGGATRLVDTDLESPF